MVGVLSEFSNVTRQYRDAVFPAQTRDSHLQRIHSSRSTIREYKSELGAFLSNHQTRHASSGANVNHSSSDVNQCRHKCFCVLNDLGDWSVAQRADSLRSGKNLFNGAANSHLTNVLVALWV
jgi:hypothetical protein